ncbi:MAG: methanol--corrinoid methyltransferase, partial [Lentisphaerae bacterium]
DKDCGYEGVFLKAISGIPISMEGKTAACAHLSSVGNVAAACADLWSNESVQNIKLLGGMTPVVYTEQLTYDCRLMNKAIEHGDEEPKRLQHLLVESDVHYDPQALILAPGPVIEIAREMVKGEDYVDATIRGCLKGLEVIEACIEDGSLQIEAREKAWIPRLRNELDAIPRTEQEFIEEMIPAIPAEKWLPAEYGIDA